LDYLLLVPRWQPGYRCHVKLLVPVLFAAAAVALAADTAPGRTWALVVGISKYQKLPNDLWLQYPDADAKTLGSFLESPRGGGVPKDQILLLTNEQATTAALRKAFDGFLREKPGHDDTVYILIAGHGTVDNRGAYILTYDSDPARLSDTALPMAELHTLVQAELKRAGRVVFLADVCRAATIAGQKTTDVGASVKDLGEAEGQMLGLMAARPKELSMEGPDYGGGHGAFTWSVLRGLSGAADTDKDGFVTASELIDFVTQDVSKLTAGKQHPRDFGSMENETRLSDLSKPGIVLQ